MVVFWQIWLYLSKVCFVRQSCSIREKLLNSDKEFVFGQKWLYSSKVVVFEQEFFFIGKSGCI